MVPIPGILPVDAADKAHAFSILELNVGIN
jgi:hypothetical protein